MYIKSIEFIDNHRQFKKGDTIEFTKNMNILVGPNGIGKTTMIRAIYEYFEKFNYHKPPIKIKFCDIGKRTIELFLEYLKKHHIDKNADSYEKSLFEKIFLEFENHNDSWYITIENNNLLFNGNKFDFIYKDNDTTQEKTNYYKVNNTNRIIESFTNELYNLFTERLNIIMVNDNDNSFKYVINNFKLFEDGSLNCEYSDLNTKTLQKYSSDYMVKQILRSDGDVYEYVRDEYFKITGKKIFYKFHENDTKNFDQNAYTIYETANTKFYNSHKKNKNIDKGYTECSSGEIDLINFLTLTSDNEYVDILFIDEPGKSLSQNYLQQAINTLNNESQIIMITHNPKIINKDCIRNDNMTFIYFNNKDNKTNCINVKKEMKKLNISFDVLVNNREILFINKCICVEGISDYKVIRHFVQERHVEIMYGCESKLKNLLKNLGIKYWIVYDLDKLCDETCNKVFNNLGAKEIKKILKNKGNIIHKNYEIIKFKNKKIILFAIKNFRTLLNDKDINFIKDLLKDNINSIEHTEDDKSIIINLNNDYDKINEFNMIESNLDKNEINDIYNKVNKQHNIFYHNIDFVDIEGYFNDISKRELQNKTDDEIIQLIKNNKDNFKELYNFLNECESNIKYDDFIKNLN
jgi:predicted ATP-dependent endonuclease of OLD family